MKGFNRLKGVATASVMGLSALAAGSGRAAVTTTETITRALVATVDGNAAEAFLYGSFTSGDTFGIDDYTASDGGTGFYDVFDGGLSMDVDGIHFSNPDGDIDITGNVITSDVVVDIVPGIDAQIQYSLDTSLGGSSLGNIRALYTLTNTTAASIMTTVNIYGNLGSDSSTTIQASSSGDTVTDNADMWTLSSEETLGVNPVLGNDPGLVITRYGTGASVMPTLTDTLGAASNDGFGNDYDMTIPAMSTQRLLVFVSTHKTNAGATATAAQLESLSAANAAGHLAGLSSTQIGEIVNYGDGVGSTSAPELTCESPGIECDGDKHTLSMSSGLLALFGLLPFLRSRRKTKA